MEQGNIVRAAVTAKDSDFLRAGRTIESSPRRISHIDSNLYLAQRQTQLAATTFKSIYNSVLHQSFSDQTGIDRVVDEAFGDFSAVVYGDFKRLCEKLKYPVPVMPPYYSAKQLLELSNTLSARKSKSKVL